MEEKAIVARSGMTFDVTVDEAVAPQTLVVVIGESLSRSHMSLYGYGRQTNPELAARRQSLKVYSDIVSPQVHTVPVLRSILTFADDEHPEYLTLRPSLFELFNRAGFETYLISNHPVNDSNSSYEPLLQLAGHVIDLSAGNEPDGVLLPELQKALDNPARKLIVLHLMGSHAVYRFRYPPSFDRFRHATADPTVQEQTINEYDNAALYNDYLITRVLDMLQERDEASAFVYFSDHGEEVYDFRNYAGHAYEKTSIYMCEVPFIVWTSDKFDSCNNGLIFREDRPYSTVDLPYSLADIAGLRFENFDTARSLFSPNFEPRERFVGELSYNEVKKTTYITR